MYHVFYPDPTERIGSGDLESYLHEEAGTEAEAIELGERAAASWRGIDREEVMIFSDGHAITLPEEPDGHRCPHCGCRIDIGGFDTAAAAEEDYDPNQGRYMLRMDCPECGEEVCAWFDGDHEDGSLEFHEIDEYSGDCFSHKDLRPDYDPDGFDGFDDGDDPSEEDGEE